MKMVLVVLAIVAGISASALGDLVCGRSLYGFKFHTDCRKFYVCNYGTAVESTCPGTTYFNGMTCDFPENVHDCVNGFRDLSENAEDEEVSAPVDETEEEQPQEPESEEQQQPEVPVVEPVPEVPEEGFTGTCPDVPYIYFATSDPTTFFICQYGQAKGTGRCGEGLVFNQAKQHCA